MLKTSDTSHVSYERVYEPSEDSFLLPDTLVLEAAHLTSRFRHASPLVVEVGCGSGVVLAFVAMHATTIFGKRDVLTMGIDVNEFACKATEMTVKRNVGTMHKSFLGCVKGDLACAIRNHTVDVLIFNPPYVPSETLPTISANPQRTQDEFETRNALSALATDGGELGMQVTNRLLDLLPLLLSRPNGVAYVLLCAQNRPDEVKSRLRAWGEGWSVETVGKSGSKGGWERLQIIRVART